MTDQAADSGPFGNIDDRVTDIVADALEQAPQQRLALVEAACAGNDTLKNEVLALLTVHDRDNQRFMSVAAPLAISAASAAATGATESRSQPDRLQLTLPSQLGRYRLDQLLGEGGMGSVYSAEQAEPVKRRVALKLIHSLQGQRTAERFARECQVLARLNHPNIAAMYEADSATDANDQQRLFVAMELVDGQYLDRWCDDYQLTIEARLRLFLGVCAAITHAHQNGVLHCDLKPSNVLVTEVDSQAVAKVIDFGIARALDPLGEDADLTRGQFLGSPQYISPEAAGIDGRLNLDARSDVYSLGLLLYLILVGVPPVAADQLTLWQYLQRLAQHDPKPPSKRFEGLPSEHQEQIAKQRHSKPDKLLRLIKGDLDAIVSKAIEREPNRRYQSARDLAADIERYLLRQPVTARRLTTAYRTKRFVRRNMVVSALTLAIVLALSAGIVARTLEAQRASAAAQEATAALREAEQTSTFLVELFEGADPDQLGGEQTIRQVLDYGAERLSHELEEQPLVRARLLQTIATVYTKLSEFEQAESLLRDALALRQAALPEQSAPVIESLNQLSIVLRHKGQYEAAVDLAEQVLFARQADPSTDSELVAQAHNNLGNLYWRMEDYATAERAHREALALRQQRPDRPQHIADSANNLGVLLFSRGRYLEARPILELAASTFSELYGPDHPNLAVTYNNLGLVERNLSSWRNAEDRYRRAADIWTTAYGPTHQRTLRARRNLLVELTRKRQWPDVQKEIDNLVRSAETLGEPVELVRVLRGAAIASVRAGDLTQAVDFANRATILSVESFGADHTQTLSAQTVLGWCLGKEGKTAQALALLEAVEEVLRASRPPAHSSVQRAIRYRAEALMVDRQFAAAAELLEGVVDMQISVYGAQHLLTATSQWQLGEALLSQGELASAAQTLNQAQHNATNTVGDEHPLMINILVALASIEREQGNLAQAVTRFDRAITIGRTIYPNDDKVLETLLVGRQALTAPQ